MRKQIFTYAKTKAQISCAVTAQLTAQLTSAFIFATGIVQSFFLLHLKSQASSPLLWLHRPVCVRPGNPEDHFSRFTAQTETKSERKIPDNG